MRRLGVAGAACAASMILGILVVGPGCNTKTEVGFSLRVPGDVADQTTWFEIGAFANGTCPPVAQLAGGIPAGSTARLAFRREAKTTPALGDLARGSYAFAAVAKGENCEVVGGGCSVVDVASSSEITITLRALEKPSAGCKNGTVCQAAQCVPSSDNGDPSVGANCSLELLGAGPLGNPLAISNTLMSDPAIVATSDGFLVAYREFDGLAGAARLTFVALDNGGGAADPHSETLPARCSGSDESDAVGMAFSKGNGLAVVARAPCDAKAGFDFYGIDEKGKVTKSGVETSANLGSSQLLLSTQHALAPQPNGSNFFLVFTKDGQALVNTTADAHFAGTPAIPYGGPTPHAGSWIATSDKLVALLAGATGVIGSPPVFDAGIVDAGKDASKDAGTPPVDDAGGPQPILRLNVAAAGANLGSLEAPLEFPGAWGSMTALGRRLVVASSGTTPGKPVAFRLFDLGTKEPVITDGFNTEGLGKVSYADVAYNQAHLFFAVEQPGAISLVAYEHADTTPSFLREVQLTQNPRVPSLKDIRDGRIAVAASDTRVAVTWITGKLLTQNDAVGGYAVFACRTP
jgi:hypothetical protein